MLLAGVGLPSGGSVASIISLKLKLLTVRANYTEPQAYRIDANIDNKWRYRDTNAKLLNISFYD
jgi:hypothetical protein